MVFRGGYKKIFTGGWALIFNKSWKYFQKGGTREESVVKK